MQHARKADGFYLVINKKEMHFIDCFFRFTADRIVSEKYNANGIYGRLVPAEEVEPEIL